ncbi:MAG: hypothetical protein ABSH22_14700 [Tepidisphaeraceae bacterium]|jgi:hypothetical protein
MIWLPLAALILAALYLPRPNSSRDFRPSSPQSWKLVVTGAIILVAQAFMSGLEAYGEHRNILPDKVYGWHLDDLICYGSLLIACALHFLSLRRKFHPITALVCAIFLAIFGAVCSMPATLAGARIVDGDAIGG